MSRLAATTDAQVERAIHVVDTSGVIDLLERLIGRAPQGRPRRLSLRTWLIGGLIAIDNGQGFKATSVVRSLRGMSIAMQWQLGVRWQDRRGEVKTLTKAHVDYLAKRLPEWLACTRAGAERYGLTFSDDELEHRRAALQDAMDLLLDASKVDRHEAGWFAADGSSTWSWGRAHRKVTDDVDVRAQESVTDERTRDEPTDSPSHPTRNGDGDGGDIHTGTDEDEEDDDGTPPALVGSRGGSYDYDAAFGSKTAHAGGRQPYFGYVLDALLRVAAPGEATVPIVIERLVISPASTDVVAPTFRLLDSLAATGVTISDLVVDRHYSYKTVRRWADQLRARRINQHFDLRTDEQKFRDLNGAKLVAGWLHCPATPDRLADIHRPAPNASKEQQATFAAQIRERETWALARDERPNPNGRARFTCPAIDSKVGCPLRPDTVKLAHRHGLPIVEDPPELDTAPACCTNRSGKVTVNEPQLRKHDQPYYWGSAAWQAAYNRRTYVEGVFGSIKSTDTEGVRRGFTRYVGLPMLSIGLTLAAAVANIRHQRNHWNGRDDAPVHPLLTDDPEYAAIAYLSPEEAAALDRLHTDDVHAA